MKANLARQLDQPAYQQVANLLRAMLLDETNGAPTALPGRQELAEFYRFAPATIVRAMEILLADGLIRQMDQDRIVPAPEGIRAWRQTRRPRRILLIAFKASSGEALGSYYSQVYQGIFTAAEQAGYVCAFRYQQGRYPVRTPEMSPEDPEQVLGVITANVLGETFLGMHAEAGYPLVCVDHWPAHPLADAVVTDSFTEGQQAVEYLMSHGHREMFFLGKMIRRHPRQEYLPEVDSMLVETGYRYATHMAGLEASSRRLRSFHQDQPLYEDLVEWLHAEKPRPTAGLIYAGDMADRLRAAMKDYNLRCPEDISLITRGDVMTVTEYTSLRSDGLQMGRMAVEVLLARASGRQSPGMRVSITSRITPGTTVAPAYSHVDPPAGLPATR